MRNSKLIFGLLAVLASGVALAAGADMGQVEKQATNWTAIAMFGIFVAGTMYITKWAASKTESAADFYTAGGGITGFQNGLAIAVQLVACFSTWPISAPAASKAPEASTARRPKISLDVRITWWPP